MAIKLRDVRVGNWVIDKVLNNSYRQVEAWMLLQSLNYYDPIPLSPDILIKCGFVKNETLEYSDAYDYPSLLGIRVYVDEPKSIHLKLMKEEWYPKIKEIKYLHDLQNVIYCLTNTEIEYKP